MSYLHSLNQSGITFMIHYGETTVCARKMRGFWTRMAHPTAWYRTRLQLWFTVIHSTVWFRLVVYTYETHWCFHSESHICADLIHSVRPLQSIFKWTIWFRQMCKPFWNQVWLFLAVYSRAHTGSCHRSCQAISISRANECSINSTGGLFCPVQIGGSYTLFLLPVYYAG